MNIDELSKDIKLYSDKYYLIQYLNNNEFCYAILDIGYPKYVFFQKANLKKEIDLYLNIEEILYKEELLKLIYGKRYLIYSNIKSTLVPSSYFSENEIKTYFQFVHNLSEYDELNYTYLSSIKAYNIFSINSELVQILNKKQKSVIFHSNHVTIETLMRVINENNCIYVYFNNDLLEIAIKENNELRYFNQFLIETEDDFLYYINLIYDQLKIEKNKLKFIYSGNSNFERRIVDYINCYFLKPLILEVNWPETDIKIKDNYKYQYFNLLYLYNCELLEENIKEEF